MIWATDILRAPGGPNFITEPPFLVSVFLAWLVTLYLLSSLFATKRVFEPQIYCLILCCKNRRSHEFFLKLSLIKAFLNAKIKIKIKCVKKYPLVRFGCNKRPREFVHAKSQNSPLCNEWGAKNTAFFDLKRGSGVNLYFDLTQCGNASVIATTECHCDGAENRSRKIPS